MNTETIFEELESHQVSLQAVQTSGAAGSFLDEIVKWQKLLQTIEAVLTVWLEVQQKWLEIEEVSDKKLLDICKFAGIGHSCLREC